ncbi:MAG: hypothetical protein RJA36_481 [Pseudomonadota bacterium]|jgi:hypothetical protein
MNEPTLPAVRGPLDATVGLLVACPLCGAADGYKLRDGTTYRWWWVDCAACGRSLDECASDRRTQLGTPLPVSWPYADQAWNEAGYYAHRLRADAQALREMLRDTQTAVCHATRGLALGDMPGAIAELLHRTVYLLPNVGAKRTPAASAWLTEREGADRRRWSA